MTRLAAQEHVVILQQRLVSLTGGRECCRGGARRDRTADLLHAMQALSQLSYGPTGGREATQSAHGCQGGYLGAPVPEDISHRAALPAPVRPRPGRDRPP